MSTNSGPGYKRNAEHRITTQTADTRVQVRANGELIADSRNAIELKEGTHPAVYYIPREDVRMDKLVRTSHETYCPFKGTASYYSFRNGAENAVWSYEQPYDEVLMIKGRLAFYPNKVDSITTTTS
jgi:uncharacterized protein (DUF427 family)